MIKLSVMAAVVCVALAATSQAAPQSECEVLANEKQLVGQAKVRFLRKCEADRAGDALAACERAAAERNLRGAARSAHIKKCLAETPKRP